MEGSRLTSSSLPACLQLPPLGDAVAKANANDLLPETEDEALDYEEELRYEEELNEALNDNSTTLEGLPSYDVYCYTNMCFTFTPPTETPTPTTPEPEPSDPGLSDGAIAGIVIGSIAGVALLGGGIYFMKKKEMLCFG
ncbi:Carcinoembryonic antigen-related cell adhesion molecule 1 [Chionoecetes opilio]|uniref:Carcinoembryonic antigen-related cell adhesion molecule 1 n=1 Tax=Chionoecetes opilio TaxID=41210 RepID=A0A8J4YEL3_CHIOP|nr:Carcinoembryonic antigen-related cell adhesion molecule 1 [Chionoecetes opilio]